MRYPLKPHERLALLRAWNEQCAWCGQPLRYDEVSIDHLLPQSLRGKTEDFRQQTFFKFLPQPVLDRELEFDLDDITNLVPSCGRDNRRKSAELPPILVILLKEAFAKISEIDRLATDFESDRQIKKALAIIESADRKTQGEVVARLVGGGIDAGIIRRLVRQNIAYSMIEYPSLGGGVAVRRLWLVIPPNHQPLAIVLEDPSDAGTSIQNAAETIAETISKQYTGYLAVLHYDQEDHEPWGNMWKPIPLDHAGRGQFSNVALHIRERMVESLIAANLIPDTQVARMGAMAW